MSAVLELGSAGAAHRLVVQGGAALAVTPGAPGAGNTNSAYTDGFGPGIYFPSTVYVPNSDIDIDGNYGTYPRIASGFARLPTGGPQTAWLSGPDADCFLLGGNNGLTLWMYSAPVSYRTYLNPPPAPGQRSAYGNTTDPYFSITINVTDGQSTLSQDVTVVNQPNAVLVGGNFVMDSQSTGYPGEQYPNALRVESNAHGYSGHNAVPFTVSDPAGTIVLDPGLPNLAAKLPFPGYGRHDVTLTVPSTGYAQATPVWFIHEMPAVGALVSAGAIYTNLTPGDVLGQLNLFSDAGIFTIALTASDGTIQVGSTGVVSLAPGQTLTAGAKSLTVLVTSGSGKQTSLTIDYTVHAGTTLAASAMTLAISTTLDNNTVGQTVGTPVVSGMAGTPVWAIRSPDDCKTIFNGDGSAAAQAPLNLFAINSASGTIVAPAQLPFTGSNPLRPNGIPITITATSGSQRCRQTFMVNVAWHAGPTIYVGQGMAAAHPGSGYEHLADVFGMLNNNNQVPLPASIAGATIYVDCNSDPNYYYDDNGDLASDGSGFRYGLRGPFKLIAADFSGKGIRTRLGGQVTNGVGKVGDGFDVSGKGFINIDSGDTIVDGFEISWCNGYDFTHGISGIRKNADVSGDFIAQNCDIHDCNNGVESGNGSYMVGGYNNRITNCGTEYVSTGATHGWYAGACTYVEFKNNLIWNCTNGHGIKTRAKSGLIQNNRVYDAERGNMSSQIDIPEGGLYTVTGNTLHKGPNALNPYVIQYLEEWSAYLALDPNGPFWRKNQLTLSNNTILITSEPYMHSGPAYGVGAAGIQTALDGTGVSVTLTNNAMFLGSQGATRFANEPGNSPIAATMTETGGTTIAAMPALDFSAPMSGPVSGRPGMFFFVGDPSTTYLNFSGVQIDPGFDDIQLSHAAPPGTVLGTMRADGNILGNSHPFVAGTTWSINFGPEVNGQPTWPPSGRYSVVTNADGTGTLSVGSVALPAAGTLDVIKVRAVAPDGTTADRRIYIPIV